jgi:hypothetical protein
LVGEDGIGVFIRVKRGMSKRCVVYESISNESNENANGRPRDIGQSTNQDTVCGGSQVISTSPTSTTPISPKMSLRYVIRPAAKLKSSRPIHPNLFINARLYSPRMYATGSPSNSAQDSSRPPRSIEDSTSALDYKYAHRRARPPPLPASGMSCLVFISFV